MAAGSSFIIDHKRGDTISWDVNYTDDLGGAVDITNYTIRCQARSKNDTSIKLFDLTTEGAEPTIDKYDPTHGNFKIVADTSAYSLGQYLVDIEYSIPGLVKSSETYELNIYEDITR